MRKRTRAAASDDALQRRVIELEAELRDIRARQGASGHTEQVLQEAVQGIHDHRATLEAQQRELRLVQEALELKNTQYKNLFEFAPVAIFSLDDEAIINDVNLTGAAGIDRAAGSNQFLEIG